MIKLEKVLLRDVCDLLNRGISPKYSDEGNLIINQKCIRNNTVSVEEARYSSIDKKISEEKYLRPLDILVNSTGTGTLGRTAQIKEIFQPTSVDTHVTIVRPNNQVDKTFIALQLALKEPEIVSLGKGATNQQELGRTELGGIELLLPPLPIQSKIAAILSAYDNLLENNIKRIKLLEELAQRTYDEWFVKFRINGNKLKINNESGLPIDWQRKKLGDILTIKNGRAYKNEEGEKVNPIYGSNGIIGRHPNFNNEDAIIIGRVGAYCGAIFYCRSKFWSTDNTITAKEISQSFSNAYAYFTLVNLDLRRLAGGSAQPLLTQSTINQIEVLVPSEKYVTQFTQICDSIFKQIDVLTIYNKLIKESKDILLPKLMNGEIEVD